MAKVDMKKQLASLFPGAGQQSSGEPEESKKSEGANQPQKTADEAKQGEKNGVNTGTKPPAKPEPAQRIKKAKPSPVSGQNMKKPLAASEGPKKTKKRSVGVSTNRKPPVVDQVAQEKEYKVAFNLQLPQSLHTRLSYYADNFAVGRKSSVTSIIITAIEQHLGELEKKAGIKN